MSARSVLVLPRTWILVGLAFPSAAWADPIALRAPQARVVASVGLPDTSVAYWFTRGFGLSAEYHAPSTVGLSAGWRADVFRLDDHFGLDVNLAGGPVLPFLQPGLALDLTPAVQLGWDGGAGHAELGLAVPFAVQLTPELRTRIPVLGELWLGGSLGSVRIGGHLGVGSMWVPGYATELGWNLGIDLGFGGQKLQPGR